MDHELMIARGAIVLVTLDPAMGHEQRGRRPAIVVSDPAVTEDARFPMVCVIPVTGAPGVGALYPALEPRTGGLVKRSWALIDQLRSIDKRRVERVYANVGTDELAAVDGGMRMFLGLMNPSAASDQPAQRDR